MTHVHHRQKKYHPEKQYNLCEDTMSFAANLQDYDSMVTEADFNILNGVRNIRYFNLTK